mmetsp:Transcript_76904/g.152204  ORF Transcript_76904/g.152204 Transcript_76904/m.152204 type:complete len:227 (-) Transcript_76904:442-1122(-)
MLTSKLGPASASSATTGSAETVAACACLRASHRFLSACACRCRASCFFTATRSSPPRATVATCSTSSSATMLKRRISSRCSNLSKPAGPPSSSKAANDGVLNSKPRTSHLSRHSDRHCRTAAVLSRNISPSTGRASSIWSIMGASRDNRLPRLSRVARRTFHCWCLRLASNAATSGPPARLMRSPSKCALTFLVSSQHSFLASGQVSANALATASRISLAKGLSRP